MIFANIITKRQNKPYKPDKENMERHKMKESI